MEIKRSANKALLVPALFQFARIDLSLSLAQNKLERFTSNAERFWKL